MLLLEILLWLALVPILLVVTYLLWTGRHGLRLRAGPPEDDRSRFVVFIPVHNEEAVIPGLLDSIARINYPRQRLRWIFLADHCSDDSVALLSQAGCDVLERNSGPRGKAAAISEGVRSRLLPLGDDYDALAVFDADNVVDPDFFRFVSGHIQAGQPAVQGRVGIEDWRRSLFLRFNRVNYAVTNRFKELARSQAGLSCRLRGHGMVFHRDTVRALDWDESSVVEDQETLLKMVMRGYRVIWEERARVNSILPTTAGESVHQRRRWAGGKTQLARIAVPQLLRQAWSRRDPVALDLAVEFLLPSYAVLLGILFMGLVVALLAQVSLPLQILYLGAVVLMLGYFSLGTVLDGLPIREFLFFALAPFFIFWRVGVYLLSFRLGSRWR